MVQMPSDVKGPKYCLWINVVHANYILPMCHEPITALLFPVSIHVLAHCTVYRSGGLTGQFFIVMEIPCQCQRWP